MSAHAAILRASVQWGARPKDITGARRYPRFVSARRQVARELRAAGWSFPEIGRALGGRHHSTIMELCGCFEPRSVVEVGRRYGSAAIDMALAGEERGMA